MREYYVVPSGVIYLALLGANATDWPETVFGRTDRLILWASGNPSARLRSALRGVETY